MAYIEKLQSNIEYPHLTLVDIVHRNNTNGRNYLEIYPASHLLKHYINRDLKDIKLGQLYGSSGVHINELLTNTKNIIVETTYQDLLALPKAKQVKLLKDYTLILTDIEEGGAFFGYMGPCLVEHIKNLNEKKGAVLRNKFLGFVFQSFNLINYKTAAENVALPLYYQRMPRKERQEKAIKYLEQVGLKDWATHLPSELSGGQKQRVAIARAMAAEPKVLLADEPTGALDSKTSYEVMDLIQKINDAGNTILVVTHEPDIADMCKRIVHLKDGVIVEDKKVKQVRAAQYV